MTVQLRRLGTAGAALVLAAGLVIAPAAASAVLSLPAPDGGYQVGTTSLHLIDSARTDPLAPSPRPRELMVRLWYPAIRSTQPVAPYQTPAVSAFYTGFLNAAGGTHFPDDLLAFPSHSRANAPAAGFRHPVVLFSPDAAGNGPDATALHEELASRGYVVVGIDHTFDSGVVEFPGGRLETIRPGFGDDLVGAVRIADTRFVLDAIGALARGGNPDAEHRELPRGLRFAIDPSRVAGYGPGLGGLTILGAMGQDRRIDAGVTMDGDPLGSASLDRPVMLLGDQHHRRADNPDWAAFYDRLQGPRLHIVIAGAEHDDLSDIAVFKAAFPGHPFFRTGPIEGARAVAVQRAYLVAWLDHVLRGWPNPLLRGESPRYPEVDFQP
jgi:dienelactone hydrolase